MEHCYNFYATLLDGYQDYIDSNKIWEQYWGSSDDPKYSISEFEDMLKQSLIDKINRVPLDSEAADKGTAFNEVIDCIIVNKPTEREDMKIYSDAINNIINVQYNNHLFVFPSQLCKDFAKQYEGAIPQVYTEGIMNTQYGGVKLYGYIDELMPLSIHDIKTTSRYNAFKFRTHWQHRVYPYCLHCEGIHINRFEYNIVKFDRSGKKYELFDEVYNFMPEDEQLLRLHCERLIEFIENNRNLITDKKIFNLLNL